MDVRTSGARSSDTCGPGARLPAEYARWEPGEATAALGVHPDDLPDGLVIADETGRVTCFNAAAARI
ncbi:PAS domain-containing sensor histidine kinase, partial [Streptomyces sp. 2MCAF27]